MYRARNISRQACLLQYEGSYLPPLAWIVVAQEISDNLTYANQLLVKNAQVLEQRSTPNETTSTSTFEEVEQLSYRTIPQASGSKKTNEKEQPQSFNEHDRTVHAKQQKPERASYRKGKQVHPNTRDTVLDGYSADNEPLQQNPTQMKTNYAQGNQKISNQRPVLPLVDAGGTVFQGRNALKPFSRSSAMPTPSLDNTSPQMVNRQRQTSSKKGYVPTSAKTRK